MLIFFVDSFFDPEKELVDLHMFDGVSVCRKAKKILKVVYPMLSYIVGEEHTFHNVFKGWAYIDEITKLFIEYKVC